MSVSAGWAPQCLNIMRQQHGSPVQLPARGQTQVSSTFPSTDTCIEAHAHIFHCLWIFTKGFHMVEYILAVRKLSVLSNLLPFYGLAVSLKPICQLFSFFFLYLFKTCFLFLYLETWNSLFDNSYIYFFHFLPCFLSSYELHHTVPYTSLHERGAKGAFS